MPNDRIDLVGSGHAVGGVELMIQPPVRQHLKPHIERKHDNHANDDMEHPGSALFRWRLFMNDSALIAPLNHLRPIHSLVAPSAGARTSLVIRVVSFVNFS